jgi:hypothetical protein
MDRACKDEDDVRTQYVDSANDNDAMLRDDLAR